MSRDDDIRARRELNEVLENGTSLRPLSLEQRRAETLVRAAMAEIGVPELSHDFTSRLASRIAEAGTAREPARPETERKAPRPALSRGRRLALHAYWMAACMASSFILFRVDWPQSVPVTVWIPAALLGLVCLTPFLLLRRTKVGFTDILLRAAG